jgi:hypothetical protein
MISSFNQLVSKVLLPVAPQNSFFALRAPEVLGSK